MQLITNEIYEEIVELIVGQVDGEKLREGVVELDSAACQVVVLWEAVAVRPLELRRWMVLSFEGGVRCGNDFSITKFMEIYKLNHTDGSN